jgi:hypothetical protein
MVTLCPVKVIIIVLVLGFGVEKPTTVETPSTVCRTASPSWVNPNVRVFPKLDEDIPTEIDPGLSEGIVKLIRIGPV